MAKKKEIPATANFEDLIGSKANLFLQKPESNQFQLGSVVFEVIEDESDGYRSSMQEVKIVTTQAPCKVLLAVVTIGRTNPDNEDIYTLIDDTGHEWLRFGTVNTDDYYPSFHFNWQPKESNELKELKKLILKK